MNTVHPIAAVPIRSVPPVTKSAKDDEFESAQPNIKTRELSGDESLRQKHTKEKPSASKKTGGEIKLGENIQRKNQNEVHNEVNYDFSRVPPPVCSCTGVARRCYKCGPGAWQSTCCTTSTSEYPLPMSASRPGRRIAGRKMKRGAYMKLLNKFVSEGRDLSHPVDLKNYWGKNRSNK